MKFNACFDLKTLPCSTGDVSSTTWCISTSAYTVSLMTMSRIIIVNRSVESRSLLVDLFQDTRSAIFFFFFFRRDTELRHVVVEKRVCGSAMHSKYFCQRTCRTFFSYFDYFIAISFELIHIFRFLSQIFKIWKEIIA